MTDGHIISLPTRTSGTWQLRHQGLESRASWWLMDWNPPASAMGRFDPGREDSACCKGSYACERSYGRACVMGNRSGSPPVPREEHCSLKPERRAVSSKEERLSTAINQFRQKEKNLKKRNNKHVCITESLCCTLKQHCKSAVVVQVPSHV